MEIEDLGTVIASIIENNIDKIHELYCSKGGFECWFQCELYYALKLSNMYSIVEREQELPNPWSGAYADLYVDGTFIELKVDSENRTDIIDGFEVDVRRMEEIGFAVLITKNSYTGSLPSGIFSFEVQDYNIFIA